MNKTLLFCMQLSMFSITIYYTDCLFCIVYSCLLCYRLGDRRFMGLFLSFPFYSIDLYFCFCASTILFWWLFLYSLKSESLIPATPFFFLKSALVIWCLLYFHINCKNFGSNFVKKKIQVVYFTEYVDYFRYYSHFHNIYSSNPRTWYISQSICVFFDFCHQYIAVFWV